MPVSRDTTICISLAGRPSHIGAAVHNAGYAALGLDFIYLPRTTTNLSAAIAGVRALGIRGCSVSMPFKQDVIPLLDGLADDAREVGAVNTVTNDGGVLTGHNTDVTSVTQALRQARVSSRDRFLVLGAGGMARACIVAIRWAGGTAIRSARRSNAAAAGPGVECLAWESRVAADADVLINATPIGMAPDDAVSPMPAGTLSRFRLIVDAVAMPPETRLCREARAVGVPVVAGHELALRQAMAQFTLYTGAPAPEAAMAASLAEVMRAG